MRVTSLLALVRPVERMRKERYPPFQGSDPPLSSIAHTADQPVHEPMDEGEGSPPRCFVHDSVDRAFLRKGCTVLHAAVAFVGNHVRVRGKVRFGIELLWPSYAICITAYPVKYAVSDGVIQLWFNRGITLTLYQSLLSSQYSVSRSTVVCLSFSGREHHG